MGIGAPSFPEAPLFGNPNEAAGWAAATGKYAADQSRIGQVTSSRLSADAAKYAADQQLKALQASLAQSQGRYNQVFPLLQGQLGQSSQPIGQTPAPPAMPQFGGAVGNYGYGTAAPPPIAAPPSGGSTPPPLDQGAYAPPLTSPSSGPVISDSLLNQQINSSQAQNESRTAGETRRQQQDLAGRGLGARSPLSQAIAAQLQGANLGANASSALGARTNAAQLNADYAQGINQAQIQAAAARYGAAQAAQASQFGSLQSSDAAKYASQVGAQASQYGSQVGAQAQMQSALQQALASAYGSQLGYQGSTYGAGLDYQASLAQSAASRQNAILQALAGFANS